MGLALKRREGSAVHIGNNIIVRVVKVVGKQVLLDFEVPRHIPVDRGEVLQRGDKPDCEPFRAVGPVGECNEETNTGGTK